MVNEDSINLLKECDAGIKMGIGSIEDVVSDVRNFKMAEILKDSMDTHRILERKVDSLLKQYGEVGKEPGAMAKTMSWMKTSFKMASDKSDKTIADLMTDGCGMGIKSLSKYINQYCNADTKAMDIAKNLRDVEEELEISLREFL